MTKFNLSLKNLAALIAFFAVSMMFSGCNDKDDTKPAADNDKEEQQPATDDNGNGNGNGNGGGDSGSAISKLEISVENGSAHIGEIDNVKLMISNNSTFQYETLSSVNFGNGNFTIELPATIEDRYLMSVEELFSTLTISNRNAKIATGFICAYKGGDFAGDIVFAKVFNTGKKTERRSDTYVFGLRCIN